MGWAYGLEAEAIGRPGWSKAINSRLAKERTISFGQECKAEKENLHRMKENSTAERRAGHFGVCRLIRLAFP